MAIILPDVGVLNVMIGCWALASHSSVSRHDKGSGSKIQVVLLNNGTKIHQFYNLHNNSQKITASAQRCSRLDAVTATAPSLLASALHQRKPGRRARASSP